MKTLEEAIRHCEEVENCQCNECGAEHRQLAEWLRELKKLKELAGEAGRIVRKAEDPRLEPKPVVWDELLELIGEPVWNSASRRWMLVIDSSAFHGWVELINDAGGHEMWITHDLKAMPLYRMRIPVIKEKL